MMNDGFVLQEEAAKALADVLREQILYQLKTGCRIANLECSSTSS